MCIRDSIKAGVPLDESEVYAVDRFVEKPDAATAQRYLDSGDYYWNSGMFMFRASAFLAELERLAPAMLAACQQALSAGRADRDFLWLSRSAFTACPKDSIDYAVMEKTDHAVVMPLTVGWNDVGSWSALWDVGERDADGNISRGDVISVDTHDSYVDATSRSVSYTHLDVYKRQTLMTTGWWSTNPPCQWAPPMWCATPSWKFSPNGAGTCPSQ